jgi:hypothetical protein
MAVMQRERATCRRAPESQRLGVQVVGGAIGDAHMKGDVLAVKHLGDRALDRLHELGGDAHLAVAAEDCERGHVTCGIVGFVCPVKIKREEGGRLELLNGEAAGFRQHTFWRGRSR